MRAIRRTSQKTHTGRTTCGNQCPATTARMDPSTIEPSVTVCNFGQPPIAGHWWPRRWALSWAPSRSRRRSQIDSGDRGSEIMIRRVAFSKAVLAGATGALAWEVVARLLIWFGVPAFDLVRLLGTMLMPDAAAWVWWPLGLCLHAAAGAIWAIFYAYLFWWEYPWKPGVQGAVFALGASVLAGRGSGPQGARLDE